ncbi:unnamed protein product [Umbelopsis sp. WA50703]
METTLSPAPTLTLGSNFELRPKQPSSDYQKLTHDLIPASISPLDGSNMTSNESSKDQPPRVLECGPNEGPAGITIRVVIQSLPSNPTLKLAFGGLVVDTKQLNNANFTTLAAIVPNTTHTQNNSSQVPISVCIYDNDTVHNSWVIGEFTYTEAQDKNDRKRSFGADPFMANKRMHEDDSMFPHPDQYPNFYSMENGMMPQNPYAFAQLQQQPQQIRSQDQQKLYAAQPKGMMEGYYRSQAPSMPYTGYPNSSMQNMMSPTGIGLTNMLGGDVSGMQSQRPPPGYLPQSSPPQQQQQQAPNYASYSGLLNKANLKIIGDLDTMAQAWTAEEWNARRRLVQFWRRQDGNEIHCDFQAVQQADRQPNSIVVSCIFWQERNDCFITSVDCIYLLESLIGVRFTVEEKNRIRRNLEGFRPLTVSKCKPDSADFFKLIMSFPNPKPRNIEKDVKVFPWKTLPYALKKIIGKYTASYSSTAGIM